MIDVYLFDWGNTLMVDFPEQRGKMCDWTTVEAITGAKETLASLSKHAQIYIVTSARDSTEREIQQAFARVGLSEFVTGYFCKDNLGLLKGDPEFLKEIISRLNKSIENIAMVGDSFDKDIKPAHLAGINAIWLTQNNDQYLPRNIKIINNLKELCI